MSEITFIATIPPISSAISLDGQGDGGKVKFDIPQSYMAQVIDLHSLSEQSLEIEIKESDSADPTVVKFIASLSPIMSAITLDGKGEGARIKLDVPRSDVDKLMMLYALTGEVLSLKIRPTE